METLVIQVDYRLYMRDGPPQLGITVVAPSSQQTRQNPNNISIQNGTHTQEGLQITKIQPGSVVDRVGQFKVGDIIIEVNGVDLQRPFAEAQKALKQFVTDHFSHGPLDLKVLRKVDKNALSLEEAQQTDEAPRIVTSKSSPNLVGALNTRKIGVKHTIKLKKSMNGFGMKIATRDNMHRARNRPIYITAITTTGSAYQDGRLREGDMLLKINGIDVQAKTQPEVTTLLKNIKANEEVEFVISRQEDLPNEVDEPEVHTYDIPLNDTRSAGLGLYLRYSCRADDPKNLSIWIEKVITGGAAWKDGRLQPDDQILAINDKELVGLSNAEASETLAAAVCRGVGPEATIRLRIQRKPPQSIANRSSETQTSSNSSNEISVSPHTQASNSLRVTKERSISEKTNETTSSILSSQTTQLSSSESLDNAAICEDGYIIHFQRDGFGRQSMSEKRHAQLNAKNTDTFKRNQKMREEKDQQRQLEEQLAKQHLGDVDKYKKKKKRSPVTWLRSQNPFKSYLSGNDGASKQKPAPVADHSDQYSSQSHDVPDPNPSTWIRTQDQSTASINFNKQGQLTPADIQLSPSASLMGTSELDAIRGQAKMAPFHSGGIPSAMMRVPEPMGGRPYTEQQSVVPRPFMSPMMQPGLVPPLAFNPVVPIGMTTSESQDSYANPVTSGRSVAAIAKAPASYSGSGGAEHSSGLRINNLSFRNGRSVPLSGGQGLTIGGRVGAIQISGQTDNAATTSGYSETKAGGGGSGYSSGGASGSGYGGSSYGDTYVNKHHTNETDSSLNGAMANGVGGNNITTLDLNGLSPQHPAKGYGNNNYYGQQARFGQQQVYQYDHRNHHHNHHHHHHQQQYHQFQQHQPQHQSFQQQAQTFDADQQAQLGSNYGQQQQHANNYHLNQPAAGQWQAPALAAGRVQYYSHQANQQVPVDESQYFNQQQQGRFTASQQQPIIENGNRQPPHHSQYGYQVFNTNDGHQLRPPVLVMPRHPSLARNGLAGKHALLVRTNPELWSLL